MRRLQTWTPSFQLWLVCLRVAAQGGKSNQRTTFLWLPTQASKVGDSQNLLYERLVVLMSLITSILFQSKTLASDRRGHPYVRVSRSQWPCLARRKSLRGLLYSLANSGNSVALSSYECYLDLRSWLSIICQEQTPHRRHAGRIGRNHYLCRWPIGPSQYIHISVYVLEMRMHIERKQPTP